ncbi:MAG: hypothetical protein ABEK50_07685 [bacterium]
MRENSLVVCFVSLLVFGVSLGATTVLAQGGDDWRLIPENRDEKTTVRKGRDKAEPEDYCDGWSEFKSARESTGGGGGGMVSGVGGSQEVSPIFDGHEWDQKVFCGDGYQGVDPWFSEISDVEEGPKWKFLYKTMKTGDLDQSEQVLYKALLAHDCFKRHTDWNAQEDYPKFAFCRYATEDMPSRSEVESALDDKLTSDMYFAKNNFLFLYEIGKKYRSKVMKGFSKYEEQYPVLKQIYVEGTKQGIEKYNSLREKYSDIFDAVEPVKKAMKAEKKPPENCTEELETLEESFLQQEQPEEYTHTAISDFRTEHPVFRPLTEALAYCYSYDKHRWIGYELLYDQTLRNGPGEVATKDALVVKTRKDIFNKLQEEKSSDDFPSFLRGVRSLPQKLESEFIDQYPPKFKYQPDRSGLGAGAGRAYDHENRDYGDRPEPAPVIQSIEVGEAGAKITFPKKVETSKNEVCADWKTLDRISHYEEGINGQTEVVYEKKCLEYKTVHGEYERQLEAALISRKEAEPLKEGMQVNIMSERGDIKDGMVIDAWWPDKPDGENLVIRRGLKVRQ